MSGLSTKRLMKELADIQSKGTPEGIILLSADSMDEWVFLISVLGDETIYKGETFALRMKFSNRYPIDVPEVTFLANGQYQPPMHPHVYSNGHICASILGSEWSPVLNAVAICITMQSMLASNKKKERPDGNDRYVKSAPSNPKLTRWHYDDDVDRVIYIPSQIDPTTGFCEIEKEIVHSDLIKPFFEQGQRGVK